jgi:hypothetical protein
MDDKEKQEFFSELVENYLEDLRERNLHKDSKETVLIVDKVPYYFA